MADFNLQGELQNEYKSLSQRLKDFEAFNQNSAIPQATEPRAYGESPLNAFQALSKIMVGEKGMRDKKSDYISKLADIDYRNKNLELEYAKLGASQLKDQLDEAVKQKEAETAKQETLNVVDQLLNTKYSQITGAKNPLGFLTGTRAIAQNTYDQLKGMLSLEKRKLLKGSGAISDYEMKILDQAATRLNTNLSNKDFEKVLWEIRDSLSGVYGDGKLSTEEEEIINKYKK